MELDFSFLPDLPQIKILKRIATNIWRNEEVRAIWVEGSFGQGTADLYSDVDLRLAVPAARLKEWETPDLTALFEGKCIAHQHIFKHEDRILLHLLLDTGDMYDLGIQEVQQVSPGEVCLVLGCRDAALAKTITESENAPPTSPFTDPDPEHVRQVIIDFWLRSNKHRKIFYRGLDPMVILGLQNERTILMRLWTIHATGQDTGALRPSIHSLTPQVRSIVEFHDNPLEILGAPGRSRQELLGLIELHQNEVSRVGRTLAERYAFEYPEHVEAAIRNCWHDFKSQDQ